MVFFQTSFPNFHYNNARTVQLVLVSKDLGGSATQSGSCWLTPAVLGVPKATKQFKR